MHNVEKMWLYLRPLAAAPDRHLMNFIPSSHNRKESNRLGSKLITYLKRLNDVSVQNNLLKGQRDYTKFVILGAGRTGSNMLASSLRSHSHVVCFGEIFNNTPSNRILWENPFYRPFGEGIKCAHELKQKDPVEFLKRYVFRAYPKTVTAVGFKLFYYHPPGPLQDALWEYLKDMTELCILHIKRTNLLRLQLSLKAAHMTKQWSTHSQTDGTSIYPITLHQDECLDTFRQMTTWQRESDKFFDFQEKTDVIYEDLCNDYAGEMTRIQLFLGVKPQTLSPSTKKQNLLSLTEAISNYWELKNQFRTGPWGHFFEE